MIENPNKLTNPYKPMPSTISAEELPSEPEQTDPWKPNPGKPLTFRTLVGDTLALTRRHFKWGLAVLFVANFFEALMGFLIAVNGQDSAPATFSGAVSFLISGPLSATATIALIWRMAGSKDCGPINVNPFAALFYGFRFFGHYLLFVLVMVGIILVCFLPLIVLLATTTVTHGDLSFDNVHPGLIAAIAASGLFGLLVLGAFVYKWFIAIEIVIGSGLTLNAAFKQSSEFMKKHWKLILPFFLICATIAPGFTGTLETVKDQFVDPFAQGEIAFNALRSIGICFLRMIVGVLSTAAAVSVYYFYKRNRELD